MLKKTFILCFFVCFLNVVNCEQYWQKQENLVLEIAKQENLPIIAVFHGAQGCPWSQKLREEVLENPLFREKINSEAILWQVALVGETTDKELRDRYKIQVSPLIVLLDPQGKEFARIEYAPLDAVGYAGAINNLIDDFQQICVALENEGSSFDDKSWQDLYQKSKKFSATCFKQVILEKGLQSEKETFFHVEKYASLLEKHKVKHPLAKKFKQELLELDPRNEQGTHFKIAVLEFDKINSRMKGKDKFEKPLIPLLQFIHKFGKTDKDNLWKAELMIAEYLFTKNFVQQALEHAQASFEAAPDTAKPQIVETIAYMKRT